MAVSRRPPPVLLVHGAGGDVWEWRLWRLVLGAAGLDPRPLSLRPVPGGPAATRLEDYEAQVRRALAALARPRAVLGASLGGLLALRAAAEADAVAAICPVPPAGTPGWPAPGQRRRFPRVVRWSTEASLEGTRRALAEAPAWVARWALRRWRDESGAVLEAVHAGVPVAPPPVPALVVHGGADHFVPAEAARHAARRLGADWVLLEGVSHLGILLGPRAREAAGTAAAWLAAALRRAGTPSAKGIQPGGISAGES